jgi:hypothetical protein
MQRQLGEHELDQILAGYCRLAESARANLQSGGLDTGGAGKSVRLGTPWMERKVQPEGNM